MQIEYDNTNQSNFSEEDKLLSIIGEKKPSVSRTVNKSETAVCYNLVHKKRRLLNNSHRRPNDRIVFKNGQFNIAKPTKHLFHIIPDIFKGLVEARWRWTIVHCFLTFVSTWLLFGAIWWLIAYFHDDLEDNHLPNFQNNTNWTPCVKEIYGFTSAFLFSIEIHTTIGYGSRSLTLECPLAMFTMCIEGIWGTILQSFMVGIVFAKLTRPKSRTETLLFTKNAVVNQRDQHLCLIFRVGNVRKSRIIDVAVHAYVIRFVTKDGDVLNNGQIKLDLLVDSCDEIIFMWPVSVVHRIDADSPFYNLSARDMLNCKLEVIVILEGTIESTGQPVQARSSYIGSEIMWGYRFMQLVSYKRERRGYEVDYSKLNEITSVDTPLCSARELRWLYGDSANNSSENSSRLKMYCKCCKKAKRFN